MDHFYALALVFLEMTFVMVGTGVLHSQRKVIGDTAFYLALGMLFLFAQLICAIDLRVQMWADLSFQVGATVLFLPYLAALLLVYIVDGTLAAQRVIIGSLALFGLYYYLAEITRIECNWIGFSFSGMISWDGLDFMMAESRRTMMAISLSHLLDLFLLPIIFTRLKNGGCRLFFCVLGALTFTQIAESILYIIVLSWNDAAHPGAIVGSLIARGAASIWLSCLASVYLNRIVTDSDTQQRSPLDIVFAFFGGYGRSKILEQRALEWEGRYQQILRNASEIMVVIDQGNRVLDANPAAARFFMVRSPVELNGRDFFAEAVSVDGGDLPESVRGRKGSTPVYFKAVFFAGDPERKRYLDCSMSTMHLHGAPVRVLIGRDVSEETRLAEDQKKLREQLAHAQRIESLGQLAGGIAHDFNNHLQAILGNVDLIQMAYAPENPELSRRLDKIAEIAEASGKLTSQLLGFARTGNYQIRILDLCQVIRQSINMLVPKSKDELEIKVELPGTPYWVKGDMIQLQQIFVNLMLNAVDAMKGKEGIQLLRIFAGDAPAAPLVPQQSIAENDAASSSADPDMNNYCFVAVQDSGHGMDEETMHRIFEPFFTTKPVGVGTGMGLAMVYGTVTSHNGWIQVASTPGEGSVFCVFLPKVREKENAPETNSPEHS